MQIVDNETVETGIDTYETLNDVKLSTTQRNAIMLIVQANVTSVFHQTLGQLFQKFNPNADEPQAAAPEVRPNGASQPNPL